MGEIMERAERILAHSDFLRAIKIIETSEESRIYCKHNIEHLLDVARIAYIIALEEGLNIRKDVIYAAALLHDAGRSVRGENHRLASAEMSKDILLSCGYSSDETEGIVRAIAQHGTDNCESKLEEILSKADKLSRICSFCKASDSCNWTTLNKEIIY